MNQWFKCSKCKREFVLKELKKEKDKEMKTHVKGVTAVFFCYRCPHCNRYFTEFFTVELEGKAEEEIGYCPNYRCGSTKIWSDSVYVGQFPDHPMGKSRYQIFTRCKRCGASVFMGSVDR